jgi:hypothetical protein
MKNEFLFIWNYFSSYNHAEQTSDASEKQQNDVVAAPSPVYQNPNDYNIMHESTCNRSPEGNNNNTVYNAKKSWTPLVEKIVWISICAEEVELVKFIVNFMISWEKDLLT